MFEQGKRKVTFLKSISGAADVKHGMLRPFAFYPGDEAEVPSRLAASWIESGLCKPTESVTIRELIELKIPAA